MGEKIELFRAENTNAVNPAEDLLKKAAIAGLLAFLTTLVAGLNDITK